jgi:iron complex outermembrane receptor protein
VARPTPEWKASAGLQYTFTTAAAGNFIARVDGSYTSEAFGNAINEPTNKIDGYTVANARLTWRARGP